MKYKNASLKKIDKYITNVLSKNSFKGRSNPEDPVFTKGIFLFGNTGTGKTYTLYAIANALKDMFKEAEVYSWQEVLFEVKRTFGSNVQTPIDHMKRDEYILLDDVGVEKDTEWSQEMFYMVINRAYMKETPVFISTNLSIEEFGKKYGDRVMGRLEEMCDFIQLKGEDRRIS